MPTEFPESDWKVFRDLREVALERLCERALRDVGAVAADSSKTHRERFRDLFARVADWDERIARGFDDPKRSVMFFHLAFIRSLGLLEENELARFSEGTRQRVESLAKQL